MSGTEDCASSLQFSDVGRSAPLHRRDKGGIGDTGITDGGVPKLRTTSAHPLQDGHHIAAGSVPYPVQREGSSLLG